MALYPNGYAGSPAGTADMRTLEGVAQRTTVQRLHPEFRKRVFALMEYAASQGVMLGIGIGWRVQPSGRPGFAEPGNSYHEGFMPGGMTRPDGVHDTNAMACDMVPAESMAWMGANCAKFGLVDFSDVNNEPWHIQPVEIPRSRNFATAMPPLHNLTFNFPAPGEELIMTPEDETLVRRIVREETPKALIPTPWVASKTTPLGTALQYVLRNTSTLYNSADGVPDIGKMATQMDGLVSAVQSVNIEAMVAAVTQAVKDAVASLDITASISEEDVEKIASASAQAVIAEIAS